MEEAKEGGFMRRLDSPHEEFPSTFPFTPHSCCDQSNHPDDWPCLCFEDGSFHDPKLTPDRDGIFHELAMAKAPYILQAERKQRQPACVTCKTSNSHDQQ
jgi:hypothetical protein